MPDEESEELSDDSSEEDESEDEELSDDSEDEEDSEEEEEEEDSDDEDDSELSEDSSTFLVSLSRAARTDTKRSYSSLVNLLSMKRTRSVLLGNSSLNF